MTSRRGWPRRTARAVLVAVLGVALGVGATVSLARTSWGGERLRRLMVARVNQEILGHIDCARLRFGGDRLVLEGVALRDPAGQLVVGARRLEVRFRAWALLGRRIEVPLVDLEAPVLRLERDAGGQTNLARAMAPRHPGSSTPASPPPKRGDATAGFGVELGALSVRAGSAWWQDVSGMPGAGSEVRVEALEMSASGHRDPGARGPLALHLDGHAAATVLLPAANALAAALTISGEATFDGETDRASARLALAAGGAHALLTAALDVGQRSGSLSLRADSIDLARLVVGAPASRFALTLDAHGSAAAGSDLADLRGALTLEVPPGSLAGRAFGPIRLDVDAEHGLDQVMHLVATLPGARLHAEGEATAQRLALRAGLDLDDLGATLGRFVAEARVPTTAKGAGGARHRRAAPAHGRSGTVSGSTSVPGSVSGSGHVELVVSGSPRAPALRLSGRLRGVRWQDTAADGVVLDASVGDLRSPLAANVDLLIPALKVGARRFRDLRARVRFDAGPRLTADLSLGGGTPLAVSLAGRWEHQHPGREPRAAVLDALALSWPNTTWRLTRPARISLAGDSIRVEHVSLASTGGQRLTLELRKTGSGALDTEASVVGLELGKLPEALLSPRLGLGGRLDGRLVLHGPANRPTGDLQLSLAGGRMGNVRDLAAEVRVHLLRGKRVAGEIAASGWGARVAGHVDLPLAFPPPGTAPLAAELALSRVDLERVAAGVAALGAPSKARLAPRGQLTAHVRLSGTGAAPALSVVADVEHLAAGETALGTLHTEIEAREGNPLTLLLDLAPPAGLHRRLLPGPASPSPSASAAAAAAAAVPAVGRVHLDLRTDFSLVRSLRHPPTSEAALSTPFHLEAAVGPLALGPLGKLLPTPRALDGNADLQLTLDGPGRAVGGHLALRVSGGRVANLPATDVALDVELGARDVRATARISRQAGARASTLAALEARLGAPLGSLLLRLADARRGVGEDDAERGPTLAAALGDTPLEIHARVGPLELRRAGLQPETDRNPPRLLSGRLEVAADATGTLRAPHLRLAGALSNLRMDDTPIGTGRVLLTYQDRRASADVAFTSARSGQLHLTGTADADVGALVRGGGPTRASEAPGLDPRRIPVSARVEATALDLSGLSGATPGLRTVSGQLFASATVTGTLADPRPEGSVEWKAGALTITGLGAYKNVHLLLHGSAEQLVLDELRAESGDGHARVTARGTHEATGGYAIDTALDLERFPAYVEGQALAAVTLHARADAHVAVGRVRAKLSVGSARVALSDAKRKHLQPLAPAPDVVLVDDSGQPLNAAQARRLEAVSRRLVQLAKANLPGPPDAGPSGHAPAPEAPAATPPRDSGEPVGEPGVVLQVDAPRNLWVSGDDANLELGLAPGFRVEISDAPRAFGQLVIKRGRVDVVGRRFDLKAGSQVAFSGPTELPELDVEAHHLNAAENITVVVNVKGTPGHLQITVRAPDRPDLTESQLYTLIVTGRLDLGTSGGTASATTPSDRAVSLVGGLVAGQLQKALARKLPFDVLTIETGNGIADARLEAGTYLTSALYVGYVGRTGADPALLQNRNAVHLEYELSARWSFQGEYGDAKTGSADMMWTKRY